MGVGVDCIGVMIEVWRDNRLKGRAGIGESGNDGDVVDGNDDEDGVDIGWAAPLTPLVVSRGTRFVEATDSPAFCSEVIRSVIDLGPEELQQRNSGQDGAGAQIPTNAHFGGDAAPELSSSFSLDSTWLVLLMIFCAWPYSSKMGHELLARSNSQSTHLHPLRHLLVYSAPLPRWSLGFEVRSFKQRGEKTAGLHPQLQALFQITRILSPLSINRRALSDMH